MADNLESYFKKHLSDDNPAEENWNIPSDDVWDKVLPEIQKKRGLFIPWKYFYLLGILVLAVLVFLLWPSGEVNTELKQESVLQTEYPEQKTLDRNSENDLPTALSGEEYKNTSGSTENSTFKGTESTEETDQLSKENNQGKNQVAEASPATEKNSTKAQSVTEQPVFGENRLAKTTTGNELSLTNKKYYTTASANGQENKTQIGKLSNRTIGKLSILTENVPLEQSNLIAENEQENISVKKLPFNNKGKFGVGFYYAPTFTSTYLNGNTTNGLLETSNQYLYSGNWGFEVNYFLSNRFTLVTGIGKSEIRSSSTSLIEFPYNTANESTMPSGDKENTSPVPMQTPFGEINTEITFLVPGSVQFPDGEPMDSEMQTEQELRYLSIPLGVEFNVIRFSRFSWFIDAGIRYNRALKDATTFNSRILHEGDDMEVMYEQMTSHPTYTENYLSFYVGTGMNWQFSKSFQLKASANYFGNITKVNIQENLSTYVNGFSLNFGIVYIF